MPEDASLYTTTTNGAQVAIYPPTADPTAQALTTALPPSTRPTLYAALDKLEEYDARLEAVLAKLRAKAAEVREINDLMHEHTKG